MAGGNKACFSSCCCCVADCCSSQEEEEGLLPEEAPSRDLLVLLLPHCQWRSLHRVFLHPQVLFVPHWHVSCSLCKAAYLSKPRWCCLFFTHALCRDLCQVFSFPFGLQWFSLTLTNQQDFSSTQQTGFCLMEAHFTLETKQNPTPSPNNELKSQSNGIK